MKKSLIISSLIIIFAILPLIPAQFYSGGFSNIDLGEGTRQILDQVVRFFTPVFEYLIGEYSGGSIFFEKVLLMILLFIVIYAASQKVPVFEGYRGVSFVVALVVSILAIRFIITEQLINAILVPYGTLGIAITTIIPFLIFTYFIYATNMSALGRRLCWIFFGIVFFSLWAYKSKETGGFGDLANQIFMWTLIAMIILFIFDRKIKAYFAGMGETEYENKLKNKKIAHLQAELSYLNEAATETPEIKEQKRLIRKEIRKLGGRI